MLTLFLFIQKTIPLQEVTEVRKAKTAAIFPNAIEIVAGSKRVRDLSLSKVLVYIHYEISWTHVLLLSALFWIFLVT
jgi:hypothetical protein